MLKAFDRGHLNLEMLYVGKFNVEPNMYTRQLADKEVDFNKLDEAALREAYPYASISHENIVKEVSESVVEDDEDEEDESPSSSDIFIEDPIKQYATVEIYTDSDGYIYRESSYIILDKDVYYEIYRNSINIYYRDADPSKLYAKLIKYIPFKKIENQGRKREVKLIAYSQGYYSINSKIQNTTVNIDENYNDDFKPVVTDIIKFLNERKSGIVVLHGAKGSGKTNFIRHLITNHPKQYFIVTNAIAENLASPEFITFMLEHKDSVLILEDCEKILMKRDDMGGYYANAISNILNMSDGLMSDIFNIKFICTFNADIKKIDEALLRKGRCFANYEFQPLCKEKTKALLNKQGIVLPSYSPMVLADIYNFSSTDYSSESVTKRKIGFSNVQEN